MSREERWAQRKWRAERNGEQRGMVSKEEQLAERNSGQPKVLSKYRLMEK